MQVYKELADYTRGKDDITYKLAVKILEDEGVNVTVRRRLGSDVDASCGQLRRKMQTKGMQQEAQAVK